MRGDGECWEAKGSKFRGRDYERVVSYRPVMEGCSRTVTFQQVPELCEGGKRQVPGEGHITQQVPELCEGGKGREREQHAQRL